MTGTNKITPTNPRLASLMTDVGRGNIKIPVFQRDYVWDDEQIISLLDSIYSGYPVGSLLLWSTKVALAHERDVGGFALPVTPDDYPVHYVLDGQQRLTTLYGVFNSDAATADPDLASRFDISFNPSMQTFAHTSVSSPEHTINLRTILDSTKLLKELPRFDAAQQERIAILTERFKDYEFPVVTIRDRTNQEVCRVFQRINSSGTRLSTLELLTAWTWSDQFDLRNEIASTRDKLSDKGYGDFDEGLLMRCLAAIAINRIDTEVLVDVGPQTLIDSMSKLKQALYATIDFLETELQIKNFVYLPFPIMTVPLTYFFSKKLKPDASQINQLKRWFWHCAFTQRYKAGTNVAVVEDLGSMEKLAVGVNVFAALSSSVDEALFRKSWRINSTSAKATICLLAQYQPRSFITCKRVDLGSVMAAYNAREFHHIYPKGFLSKSAIGFHEANVIANICLLTASDNKIISDKDPALYFKDIPEKNRTQVLGRALIAIDSHDGTQPFVDFLEYRCAMLKVAAENLIANGDPLY